MTLLFTTEDIIRFIYRETEERENRQIEWFIYKNTELKNEYKSLKETCKYLDSLKISPDDKLISNILNGNRN
jgi:hypothetical protein